MAKIVIIIELFFTPSKGWCKTHVYIFYDQFFLHTALITSLPGQLNTDPCSGKPTVTILDYEVWDVSIQEVQTISECMRMEIGNTKAVDQIMEEQGFQQTGSTEIGRRYSLQGVMTTRPSLCVRKAF